MASHLIPGSTGVRGALHGLVSVPSPAPVPTALLQSVLSAPSVADHIPGALLPPHTLSADPIVTTPSARPPMVQGTSTSSPVAAPLATGPSVSPQGSVGVFITRQSLLTFPVASTAVIVVSKVLHLVFPALGSPGTPFFVSLIVGLFIYYISLSTSPTRRDKFEGFGIAILNSFWLAASALGIAAVTS